MPAAQLAKKLLSIAAVACTMSALAASPTYSPRDLTGTWSLIESPYVSQEMFVREARLTDPDGLISIPDVGENSVSGFYGRRPLSIFYTPEFDRIHQTLVEQYKAGRPYRTGFNCVPNGLFSMMATAGPIQILRNGNRLFFAREPEGDPIQGYFVYLGRSHLKRFVTDGLYGDSVGHWDGNVLVVDSVNLGMHLVLVDTEPHSQSLHIIQRLQRPQYDTLIDELVADDPRAFAKPVRLQLKWKLTPNEEFTEAECDQPTDQTPMAEAPE